MRANEAFETVIDSDTGTEARERARFAAERRAEAAKRRIGEMALNTVEGYFPEEARSRRRRTAQRAFLLGVGVGILIATLLGGRR